MPKRHWVAAALTLCILSPLRSDDQATMIDDNPPPIQIIDLSVFSRWPSLDGGPALTVALAGSRVYAAWPGGLLSLDGGGKADEATLLALWASTSPRWIPGPGGPGEDGVWRCVDPDGRRLLEVDLATGEDAEAALGLPPVDSAHPMGRGLLVVAGGLPYYVPRAAEIDPADPIGPLAYEAALVGPVAVSSDGRSAWWDFLEGELVVGTRDGRSSRALPWDLAGPPASLAWVDEALYAAVPGRLVRFVPSDGGEWTREDPGLGGLASGWCALSGGDGLLAIHNPRTQRLVLARIDGETRETGGLAVEGGDESLDRLLRERLLSAGNALEGDGLARAAESFYAWALPLLRARRSRDPLDPDWPRLEDELVARRLRLRRSF